MDMKRPFKNKTLSLIRNIKLSQQDTTIAFNCNKSEYFCIDVADNITSISTCWVFIPGYINICSLPI